MSDQRLLPLDYATLLRVGRRLDPSKTPQKIRIALLSDAASQQFVPLLRALFHRQGVDAAIYEGAFDAFRLETLDPDSALYHFQPDVPKWGSAVGQRIGPTCQTISKQSDNGHFGPYVAMTDRFHPHRTQGPRKKAIERGFVPC
jgi:hypothetical protein